MNPLGVAVLSGNKQSARTTSKVLWSKALCRSQSSEAKESSEGCWRGGQRLLRACNHRCSIATPFPHFLQRKPAPRSNSSTPAAAQSSFRMLPGTTSRPSRPLHLDSHLEPPNAPTIRTKPLQIRTPQHPQQRNSQPFAHFQKPRSSGSPSSPQIFAPPALFGPPQKPHVATVRTAPPPPRSAPTSSHNHPPNICQGVEILCWIRRHLSSPAYLGSSRGMNNKVPGAMTREGSPTGVGLGSFPGTPPGLPELRCREYTPAVPAVQRAYLRVTEPDSRSGI